MRLTPNEVSFSSGETAWPDIYGFRTGRLKGRANTQKDPMWYVFFLFLFFGLGFGGLGSGLAPDECARERERERKLLDRIPSRKLSSKLSFTIHIFILTFPTPHHL